MSRHYTSLTLCFLAAILWLGAIAASPAFAGVTINSLTVTPNPLPATGGAVPVYVDCSTSNGVPTGSATLTNTSGTVLSSNILSFYSYDSNGNPVVYTYLVVPINKSTTTGASYTINVTVSDGTGSPTHLSQTFTQSFGNPIAFNTLAATPNPLQATDKSLVVNAGLICNGANQSGFYKGMSSLFDSTGKAIDIEPLFPSSSKDSGGYPLYHSTLGNIPANTTSAAKTFTIRVDAEDNSGVTTSVSLTVTQSAGKATTSATAMAVLDETAVLGTVVPLKATLTVAASGAGLSGKNVTFQVNGTSVATATTDTTGVATASYTVSSSLGTGDHPLAATFAGDSANSSASDSGILTVTPPAPPTLTNSSFETVRVPTAGKTYRPTNTGWTFVNSSGIESNGSNFGAASAPDGTQAAFLQNTPGVQSSFSQTVNFPAAGTFKISVRAARHAYQVQPIRVSIDGVQVGTYLTPGSASFTPMTTGTFKVNNAGSHVLKFETTNATHACGWGTFLDQIAVVSG